MVRTKVALLGSGFIADIHAESFRRFVPDAEVTAVYSRNIDKARAFADAHGIPEAYDDIQELLDKSDIDIVDICLPNDLHHPACICLLYTSRCV